VVNGVTETDGYFLRDDPNERREGRRVWKVVIDGWQHGDHEVYQRANAGRRKDDVRNGVVDVEGRDDEACQEQENGDMKKARDGLHGDGCIEAGNARGKVGTDASALMSRDMRVSDIKVLASPALLESCQQSAKEGYDKAQKPERVDHDGRSWWLKTGLRWDERFDRGTGPVRETVELLRYLGENFDSISRRVGQQRLVTVDDKGGECGGE